MKYFKRLSLILALCALSLFSQDITAPKYLVYKETVLSSAAEVITLQQPTSGANQIYLADAGIYCSVDCTITIEKNGTAATATPLSVVQLQDTSPAATVTAFSSSNVGVGTVLNKVAITGGTTQTLDLSGMGLSGNAATTNFTLRSNSISGTIRVIIRFYQR